MVFKHNESRVLLDTTNNELEVWTLNWMDNIYDGKVTKFFILESRSSGFDMTVVEFQHPALLGREDLGKL